MHNFLDEMKMVETKLNALKHSMKSSCSDCNSGVNSSNSSTSTKSVKRERTHNITTENDVITAAVSQSPAKYRKCH
jgi:uridylate kinase